MMRIHLLLIVILGLFIVTCQSNKEQPGEELQTFHLQTSSMDSLLNYSTADFHEVEDQIGLKLKYTWSLEATGDEHKAFYAPTDLDIAGNGEIFIVDSKNNRIQVFDSARVYLRSIGHEGDGPGEFLFPDRVLTLPQEQILVDDPFHMRYQILDQYGEFYQSFSLTPGINDGKLFEDSLLIFQDARLADAGNPDGYLFVFSDLAGNLLREIGKHKHRETGLNDIGLEGVAIAVDMEQNHLFAGYGQHNHIERYTYSGELIQTIFFESPGKQKFENGVQDLAFANGYLYALVLNRPESEDEIFAHSVSMRSGRGSDVRILFHADETSLEDTTDLYRLIVFDQWGRLVSNNLLSKYVDRIIVYYSTLYLIDSFIGMSIFEYGITMPGSR